MQRRQGDTILIGDEIEIQILESTRSHVKLGLVAPKCLPIVRGEVRKVGEQNRSAAHGTGTEPPALLARRLRQEMASTPIACTLEQPREKAPKSGKPRHGK